MHVGEFPLLEATTHVFFRMCFPYVWILSVGVPKIGPKVVFETAPNALLSNGDLWYVTCFNQSAVLGSGSYGSHCHVIATMFFWLGQSPKMETKSSIGWFNFGVC